MSTQRLEALKGLVEKDPADCFAHYGLAMEYTQAGNLEEAASEYRTILSLDPHYKAAYYHGGQVLEQLGKNDEARSTYLRGTEIARLLGDTHLLEQLQEALKNLS